MSDYRAVEHPLYLAQERHDMSWKVGLLGARKFMHTVNKNREKQQSNWKHKKIIHNNKAL